MAPRKKSARTRKPQKKANPLGSIAFIGLLAAAVTGWWYAPHIMKKGTQPASTSTFAANTRPAAPRTKKTPRPEIKPNIKTLVVSRPPDPPLAVVPQQRPQTAMTPTTSKSLPAVPYKPDTTLPPRGRFGVNNAANAIFARRTTLIFATKNKKGQPVARVARGQEMRSYEKNGNWHRIVVPSTNIIGWAEASDLTTKAPFFKPDRAATGAIK